MYTFSTEAARTYAKLAQSTHDSGKIMQSSRMYIVFLLLSLAFATDHLLGQIMVQPLGPNGGDVRSLAVHPDRPNVFFLGTADGQIFTSRTAGDHWTKLVPGLNRRDVVVDNLAFDPWDPLTVYAGTWELKNSRGSLFRSRDQGKTWEELSLGRYSSTVRAIAIAPSDSQVIALGISEGVILSVDGGQTWDRITRGYRSLYNVESLSFDPQDSNTLYVGTWHLGWKTTDHGKSWKPIHKGMIFDSDMFSLLVDPQKTEVLYSSTCTGVYKSNNAGLNWTKLKNGLPKEARRTRMLHLDPSNSDTIYAGTTLGLFASHNAGDSWKELFPGVVINAIAVHPRDSQIILVGTDDAGVLKSEDGGLTFSASNIGFTHRQIVALRSHPNRPNTYYTGVSSDGRHGGFFSSSDGGRKWSNYNEGFPEGRVDIKTILPARHSNLVYVGTHGGVFAGTPNEDPWQAVDVTRQLSVSDLTFTDSTENALFLATSEGVFHLNLKGNMLKKLSIPVYKGKVSAIVNNPSSKQLFAATDMGVFRSKDSGKTWMIKVKGLPDTPIHALEKSGQRLFCGSGKGLFFSDDDGETWSKCGGVFPISISVIGPNPSDGNQIFAADFEVGHLFYSNTGGDLWTVLDLGFNNPKISALTFSGSGNLVAGTISEGIYEITLPESLAGR